jgi:hypothetical protein
LAVERLIARKTVLGATPALAAAALIESPLAMSLKAFSVAAEIRLGMI